MRMLYALVLASLSACTVGDPAPAPAPTPPKVTAHDDDLDACEVTCDLLRVTACVGLEAEPLCDYDWLCPSICDQDPTQMICIRVSPDDEVCCQNYYGCQDIVTPDCSWAC